MKPVQSCHDMARGKISAHRSRATPIRKATPLCKTGLLTASLLALSACTQTSTSWPDGAAAGQGNAARAKLGVLLPLSGKNATLGGEMLRSVRLALSASGGSTPQVDVHDTAGPAGVTAAAQTAISAGDGLILGPLTAQDTASIASMTRLNTIPVLAFTSDVRQASPGVWTLGITPEQQVTRLVAAAKNEGRHSFAALLPDTPFGHAMGDGLLKACTLYGLPAPQIEYHAPGTAAITAGLQRLIGSTSAAAPQPAASSASTTDPLPEISAQDTTEPSAPGDALPPELAKALASSGPALSPVPEASSASVPEKLPFDALLLGDTGLELKTIIDSTATYHLAAPQVRILGPALWGAFSSKLGGIQGAWYAGVNPAARQNFVSRFQAENHHVPTPLADIAYDGGIAAATVATQSRGNGFPASLLTRPEGFQGASGTFILNQDGTVRRDLAVFEVQAVGGGRILDSGVAGKS
ncbi:penicillin-binding protein activator [Acetobacter sp. AN02]|uniref:penicillin-binding protein activator n=1 Tax=Acetobacter sp. AN02 TaxID=2894186 RepID=UPI0024344544|nr:penicillin-binding protein activator [Acetobacter sp. AN02]MDG6095494.1 penicillin-binding protein activator [Acetobacter sp. AN02]